MPAQARLGDKSKVDADAHGCPACAHSCTGPAVSGSPNVFVNGKPAVRIGDTGVHAGCCGPNTWKAIEGAPHVFINGRAAHRLDDKDQHCGGVGKMVEGSPNVATGNGSVGGSSPVRSAPAQYERGFTVYFEGTAEPVPNQQYEIERPDGSHVRGRTDADGRTRLIRTDEPGGLKLRLLHDEG